jgi:hypothetical protein
MSGPQQLGQSRVGSCSYAAATLLLLLLLIAPHNSPTDLLRLKGGLLLQTQ